MSVAISFVIPIFKKPVAVIEKCLKSILDQSLVDYEVICVFDGENQDLEKSVARFGKKFKAPFRQVVIEHGGAPKARNVGSALAVGRYVVAWDADCYIEPHAAKAWVDILDARPEVDFVYSGYKFANEMGAIPSQPFDPYLLNVTNYISSCFPVRASMDIKWDEDLESLQDWSRWLSVVSKGGVGHYLPGYAFSTEYPDPESISGKGCTPDVWLSRVDKVRAKHGLPKREVCVTSVSNKHDGIALAKLIGADYHDRPNDKPNHYKTIIQIGFCLNPGVAETHATAWGPQHKKVLFWVKDDIEEAYHAIALSALDEYAARINQTCVQFCEDIASKKILERCGFTVEVMPLPLVNTDAIAPLPELPRFLVDASAQYGHALAVVKKALPDVRIDVASGAQAIDNYTGMINFYVDRTLGSSVKRMLAAGRHVVSNVQSEFCGFLDDRVNDEKFIVDVVERIRKVVKQGPNDRAASYYKTKLTPARLLEVIR